MKLHACLFVFPLVALPAVAVQEPHTNTAQVKVGADATTEKPIALELDPAKIEQRDVTVAVEGGTLKIESGHKQDWPGLTLKAPGGKWDWSAHDYFAVDVKNSGANKVAVSVRVDNPGA